MSEQLIGDLLSVGGKVQEERDRLKAELQESERLRQEAFQAYETMRLERDELKVQLQEKELRRKRAAELYDAMRLERDEWKAGAEYAQQQATQLRQQVSNKQQQSQVLMKEQDDRTAQLQSAIQRIDELQAQLEAAAVTPAQQPDGNAAQRLEAVRRMIGEIRGWYACSEYLDGLEREHWEQVGALLGRLQREAG